MELEVDDYVKLVEPFELIDGRDPDESGDYAFETVDVTPDMLEILAEWDSQTIGEIDEDGDLKFWDIPYTWPQEVVAHIIEGGSG